MINNLWLKDYRGGYTLVYAVGSDKNMSVDSILNFMKEVNDIESYKDGLGWNILEDYENLTTEKPEYIPVKPSVGELITLQNEDTILQSSWNGERWYDNRHEYAPVYEMVDFDGTVELIGVVVF